MLGLVGGLILLIGAVWWSGAAALIPLAFADQALWRRDDDRAAEWAARARRLDRTNVDVEFVIARVDRRAGRLEEAAAHVQAARSLGADETRVRREEMLILAHVGRLDGIEESLNAWLAAATVDDRREICEAYANGLAHIARFDHAIGLLDAWQRDFPDDPEPLYRLGRLREHMRQNRQAEEMYRAALERDPRHVPSAYRLALRLLDRREVDEALALFRVCADQPHPIAGNVGVGQCLKALGQIDVVYYANGDGTFRNATEEAGLVPGGKGLGAMTADLDVDGDLDVYVANDTTPNLLYLNEGDGRFVESGLISGTAHDDRGVPNGSMGIAMLDFNRDLLPDLWVANYEKETFALYRNDGEAAFAHVSERSGISVLGGLFVGFGTVANDVDRDEDLIVANGHVMYHSAVSPVLQQAFVLRNDGGDRFLRESFPTDSYFSQEHWGRGVVTGDLGHDGDADLVFSNINEPPAVLLNETDGAGRAFATRLVGRASNRDGIGARLTLETTAGMFFRTVCGGGSYLSQSDYAVFWTLPDGAEIRQLTVNWPGGAVQTISGEALTGRIRAREVRLVEPATT